MTPGLWRSADGASEGSTDPWPMPMQRSKAAYGPCAIATSVSRTTGTLAVVMAHALGARRIVLAGIDLYTASRRYVYESGPHYRALMGHDSDMHAHDQRLHDRDLDRAILAALNERPEVDLFAASPNSGLAEVMDPAPLRSGPTPKAEPHDAPADWAPRAGLYPIWLLRGLRRARKLQRRLGAGLSWVGQGR
jgi:hypothetical protein